MWWYCWFTYDCKPHPSCIADGTLVFNGGHVFCGPGDSHEDRNRSSDCYTWWWTTYWCGFSGCPSPATVVHTGTQQGRSDDRTGTSLSNFLESDHDLAPSSHYVALEKISSNSRALVSLTVVNAEALSVVSLRKPKRSKAHNVKFVDLFLLLNWMHLFKLLRNLEQEDGVM